MVTLGPLWEYTNIFHLWLLPGPTRTTLPVFQRRFAAQTSTMSPVRREEKIFVLPNLPVLVSVFSYQYLTLSQAFILLDAAVCYVSKTEVLVFWPFCLLDPTGE